MSLSEFLVSDAHTDAGEHRITRIGKVSISNTTVIIKPTNALQISSGGEVLGVPYDRERFTPSKYAYPFVYYEDFDFGRKNIPEYFVLEILFLLGDDEVLFQPGDIVLRTSNTDIRPKVYYPLERRYGSSFGLSYTSHLCMSPGSYSSSPANPLKHAREVRIDGPLKLEKEKNYCFALKFLAPPPHPQSTFSVNVDGLRINGEFVSLQIVYRPGVYKQRGA